MAGIASEWHKDLDKHRLKSMDEIFSTTKPVIGMVHLPPLPGTAGYTGYSVTEITDFALRDARTLAEGGVDGIIVENMWDVPFTAHDNIDPEQMCAHAVAAAAVVKEVDLPVGINVIHNGGRICLAVALAAGADFMRVCMLTGAGVWDGGEFDRGVARELLTARKLCEAEHIKLFCDVDKKHVTKAQADFKKAFGREIRGYTDYRKLLEAKDIDAVVVATPDHWHALPTVNA